MSSVYDEMARAFTIFASYPDERPGISAEHDEIWAGPNPAVMTAEDLAELEQLRWMPDHAHETFHRFT
jgi:hypothetical protein